METQKLPELGDVQVERANRRILLIAAGAAIGILLAGAIVMSLSPLFILVLVAILVLIGLLAAPFGLIGWRLVKPVARPMVPAFAVQAAHTLYQILVVPLLIALVHGDAITIVGQLLEAWIFIGLLIWLITRPGLPSVVALTVLQALESLVLFSWSLSVLETAAVWGLLVNVLIRVVGIALMWVGWRKIQAQSALDSAAIGESMNLSDSTMFDRRERSS